MSTFVVGDIHGRRSQLRRLLDMLPREPARDTLVLLGDLIDRGEDVPGTVADVMELREQSPDGRVVILRGNHEQMLLDFLADGHPLWLHPAVGSGETFEQYTSDPLGDELRSWWEEAQRRLSDSLPPAHVEFFRSLPLFYEDEHAFYVHAGLDGEKHPRETDSRHLLWTRNPDFYKHYYGKPCVFGHTPTPLLPLLGRIGRHGIYIAHSAIGIDTGYDYVSPLSCLQLPDFNLYQTFADGRTATFHITTLIPKPFHDYQRDAARGGKAIAEEPPH
ncbi:MAG TPA: metallophosphoesterase family protein [Pyrinomonadaceae bacterium]|nr:metallophosphoesterase family protein [Pyrinomonadaceae bacterium]